MPVLSPELREKIKAYIPKYPRKQAVTLPALHLVHDELRTVSNEAVVEIAELLDLHPAEVLDTMTFYHFFKGEGQKLGRTRLWVCRGATAPARAFPVRGLSAAARVRFGQDAGSLQWMPGDPLVIGSWFSEPGRYTV